MLYAPYIRYFPFSLHILTPEHSMQKNNNIHQKTHLHIECLPKQASCFGWLPHHLPNEGHISKIKFIISLWKQLTEVTSQVAQTVKNPPSMQETWVPSLGFQDPLEQGLAYDSSMVAWRIPWTKEPGPYGLWAIGLHRVGHNWSDLTCVHAERGGLEYAHSFLDWKGPQNKERIESLSPAALMVLKRQRRKSAKQQQMEIPCRSYKENQTCCMCADEDKELTWRTETSLWSLQSCNSSKPHRTLFLFILGKKIFYFFFFFVGQPAPHSLQDLSSPTRDLQWKSGVLPPVWQGGPHLRIFYCFSRSLIDLSHILSALSALTRTEPTGGLTCVSQVRACTRLQTPKTEALGHSDIVFKHSSPTEAWKGGSGGQRARRVTYLHTEEFGFYFEGSGNPWMVESGFAFYRCDGGQA